MRELPCSGIRQAITITNVSRTYAVTALDSKPMLAKRQHLAILIDKTTTSAATSHNLIDGRQPLAETAYCVELTNGIRSFLNREPLAVNKRLNNFDGIRGIQTEL